ncbi:MAG: type IA DNA topoisomerase, partial [Lachnospiraceae bacterium]|nr:type IA DNA topoisomerase [Lachnospiraceae bacterium]
QKRVWIDSQTEEEILRGIREAKDLSYYDHLSDAAYLRAQEDYLMGINFSRVLTLKFGDTLKQTLKKDRSVLSVGRVMTCVLGMVVRREREIRNFKETPFYRVLAHLNGENGLAFDAEWKAVEGSRYFGSPKLYRENGFKERKDAEELIRFLSEDPPVVLEVLKKEKKTENKKPPLLFNLAELQNECSRRFKKSPDETLAIVQELYEKKLVTYPRTDARVLSSAVAKEIDRNIKGLGNLSSLAPFVQEIMEKGAYKTIGKSQYTDDRKITDHYAIIPTGQGLGALNSLDDLKRSVYDLICRRFLSIFYPAAKYERLSLELVRKGEHFFFSERILKEEGYLKVLGTGAAGGGSVKKEAGGSSDPENGAEDPPDQELENGKNPALTAYLDKLKKGDLIPVKAFEIKEGKTQPPKRYTSGNLILAMENAGQLIEDEDLRAQIKGSGIGTSATRAEILKKLNTIHYLKTNKKTQQVSPELEGELVFDVVDASMKQLLNPDLTASWEKGLSGVAEGSISTEEYMEKLSGFVTRRVNAVKGIDNPGAIRAKFREILPYYKIG